MVEMYPQIPQGKTENSPEILSLLYNMRKGKKNHALLTEYFMQEFASRPEKIIELIRIVKSELTDASNLERERMARRYLFVFSFLCERFGLYEEKLELDDLCFQITQPKEYKKLRKELEKYQKKSQKIIDEIFIVFRQKLEHVDIDAQIKGRYKNILSIYKKCKKKNIKEVFSLHDIFAFRIVVDGDPEKCFEILNVLHDSFVPLPRRFKDYVSIPKINGYQSLHTGLIGVTSDLDLAIEVQIRTKVMDEIADSGIAAHFLYAQDKLSKKITEKEKKLIENMEKITDSINKDKYVYCITPDGDIIRLQNGSTVNDFAEKIHSGLARRAKSAVVNNFEKPLHYQLQNFDSIEIVTK